MRDEDEPRSEFENASEKLKDGLRSCHHVIENYRAMLKGEDAQPAAATGEDDRA